MQIRGQFQNLCFWLVRTKIAGFRELSRADEHYNKIRSRLVKFQSIPTWVFQGFGELFEIQKLEPFEFVQNNWKFEDLTDERLAEGCSVRAFAYSFISTHGQ